MSFGLKQGLLNIHGKRLQITHPDTNGNCNLVLDGLAIDGVKDISMGSGAGSIVALAGGGQSSGTPVLQKAVNILGTVATTSDSVMLPPLAGAFPSAGGGGTNPGLSVQLSVINPTSIAAAIFPSSGDAINALAANASLALASSGVTNFYAQSSGHWYTK